MARYRLEFDIKACEGNFQCVTYDATHFMALPGGEKSDVPEGHMERGLKVLDIDEADLASAKDACAMCPPKVIRVRDLETGETVAGPEQLPSEAAGQRSEGRTMA